MSEARDDEILFVCGDIFQIVTGGTLCDRMLIHELERSHRVRIVMPQLGFLARLRHPLLAGLLNNLANLFRGFPRGAVLFVDHGAYRDCFLAINVWKWLYRCRLIGVVYHLDYTLGQMRGGGALRRAIERAMVHAYDYVLTISRSTASHLEGFGHDPERIALIPVSRRFGPQADLPSRGENAELRFLFVGSIEPRKGLLDAIEALGKGAAQHRVSLTCVGPCDRESAHFRDLNTAAGKFSNLRLQFTGAVPQEALVENFKKADVFLFPSYWEGYGIAIEEAMCFALPVIAYEAGAVPELVENGVTGWLAPVGDINALSRAVRECIEDPTERRRRGERGLETAKWTTREQDLGKILREAISGARDV